uniref:Putative salivary secreted protein n=1 Tax=Ixodes ricinus TaxID=34613 RepID=A0A6B0US31_IXORI
MLLILFATVLIVAETINGEKWPNYSNNTCIALIKEGGEIACNLTGQGHYDRMSIGNCWVSCTERYHDFLLPPAQCERIFRVKTWAIYQKMFGELPPYGFEYCDEDDEKRLRRWVDDWINYKEKARKTLCPRRRY